MNPENGFISTTYLCGIPQKIHARHFPGCTSWFYGKTEMDKLESVFLNVLRYVINQDLYYAFGYKKSIIKSQGKTSCISQAIKGK